MSGKKALAADIVHTNDQKEELIELTEMCKQPEQFLCETFLKPMTQNEPVQVTLPLSNPLITLTFF